MNNDCFSLRLGNCEQRKGPLETLLTAVLILCGLGVQAQPTLFQDSFQGKLGAGWSWRREHPNAWRVTPNGLEVRVEPGDMWGPQNDAHNLLVRDAPETNGAALQFGVTVENRPSHQYEQVDLVYYFDDSNMVKLGLELVDGHLSIVMGREERDHARTVAMAASDKTKVRLMLRVQGRRIRGQFQVPGSETWQELGECEVPQAPGTKPKFSLQFYQGPADAEHWARVSEFYVQSR